MGQSANDNINIDQQLQELKPQVEILRGQRQQLEHSILQSKVILNQINWEKAKITEQIEILENNQIRLLKNEIVSSTEQIKEVERLIAEQTNEDSDDLAKQLKAQQKKYEKQKRVVDEKQDEIDDLERQIDSIGNSEVSQIKKNLNDIKEKIDLKNKELAEQQNDKKRGETAVGVLQKEKASKEKELQKIERLSVGCQNKLKVLEEITEDILLKQKRQSQEIEEWKAKRDESEKSLTDLKKVFDDLRYEINKVKSEKEKLTKSISELDKERKEYKKGYEIEKKKFAEVNEQYEFALNCNLDKVNLDDPNISKKKADDSSESSEEESDSEESSEDKPTKKKKGNTKNKKDGKKTKKGAKKGNKKNKMDEERSEESSEEESDEDEELSEDKKPTKNGKTAKKSEPKKDKENDEKKEGDQQEDDEEIIVKGNRQKIKTNNYTLNEILEQWEPDEEDLDTEICNQLIDQIAHLKELVKVEVDDFRNMKGNMHAINEFKTKYDKFVFQKKRLDKAEDIELKCVKRLHEIKNKRKNEFEAGFFFISKELKATYQQLTNGGDAELTLLDSADPFMEGILYEVRPPKKTWKQMHKLSGGEKTLCSLALIFALHSYRPNPLYFMDEIDAALDFKNVGIIGKYIKERTKDAQFIVISLRNNMFELADTLNGIYKTRDTTKSIAIEPNTLFDMWVKEDEEQYKIYQKRTVTTRNFLQDLKQGVKQQNITQKARLQSQKAQEASQNHAQLSIKKLAREESKSSEPDKENRLANANRLLNISMPHISESKIGESDDY